MPRDPRYPELNATRQRARAIRQRRNGGWNAESASHSPERLRAWQHIVRLAGVHDLPLTKIRDYMSRPNEWACLEARFLASPPQTYAAMGRQLRCTIEAIDNLELRALFRVLTRLLAYDAAVRGEPDHLSVHQTRRWD